MGYVIAAILVVLIVGGFVLFLVTNATKKSNVSDAGDPGADQNPMGIVGSDDETPAGDTERARRRRPTDEGRFRREDEPSGRRAGRRRRRGGGPNGPRADILDALGENWLALVWTQSLGTNEMSRRTDALHSPAGAPQPSSSVNGAPDRAPRLR